MGLFILSITKVITGNYIEKDRPESELKLQYAETKHPRKVNYEGVRNCLWLAIRV